MIEPTNQPEPSRGLAPDLAEEQADPAPPVRGRRQKLDESKRKSLKDRTAYAVKNLLDGSIEATFEGDGITKHGSPPRVVGLLLTRFSQFLESFGGEGGLLTAYSTTNSFTVTIKPIVSSSLRHEVDDLVETNTPIDFDDPVVLRHFVPDSVSAAEALADLLSISPAEAIDEADRFSAKTANAYIQFAKALDETGGEVVITTPAGEEVRASRDYAKKVVEAANETERLQQLELTVIGKLTRADSEEQQFRIVLDKKRTQDAVLSRFKAVEGGWTHKARQQVQEQSLWDTDVRAQVTAYATLKPGRRTPLYDEFVFSHVESLDADTLR